ncbi:cyclin-A3-2-like isoform X2 [Ananas comosus]|uniref:Cyclin-A3-2-like isoform X2 n=1 Tax=Ananas comosus TaxID=4615 RepID=A0A6P5G9M5_ANACO|nr:cyclin-A3-2-like isoform X2 [Ananas comosus]
MANKENNCARLTRSAASAAAAAAKTHATTSTYAPAAAAAPPPRRLHTPAKRKRKALAELPNLSNVAPAPNPPPFSKPRTRSKAREEAAAVTAEAMEAAAAQKEAPLPLTSSNSPSTQSNEKDPQICSYYAGDIYHYLRSLEAEPKRRPIANFIETIQKDITENMRGMLVDWLVAVAEEKYEEISPPHVEDFCYITDNSYTKQEVVKMEAMVLKFLNFEMGDPTVKTFLRRFTKAGQGCKYPNLLLEFLGNYLAELSLVDYGCVRFLPSVIAASSVFLARFTINPRSQPWSLSLQSNTGYSASELRDCIAAIHDLQLNRKCSALKAIKDKYKQHKFKSVSTLVPRSEIPPSFFKDYRR